MIKDQQTIDIMQDTNITANFYVDQVLKLQNDLIEVLKSNLKLVTLLVFRYNIL